MAENKLTSLLDELFSKKITRKSSSIGDYSIDVIDKEGRVIVEQIIRQFLLDNRDENKGILEAKVFAYEQMISNSNFAPIIKKDEAEHST